MPRLALPPASLPAPGMACLVKCRAMEPERAFPDWRRPSCALPQRAWATSLTCPSWLALRTAPPLLQASPPALKVASVAVDPISVTASAATVSISIARADGSPLLPELPKEDAASAVRTSSMVLSWARAQGLKFVIETAPNTISATMYSFVGTVWTPAKGAFEGSHASAVGTDPMAPAHGKVAGGKFRFRLTGLPEESPLCVRVSLESTGGKSGTVETTFATISKAAEPEVLKKAALERERRIAASKAVTHVRSTALKTKSADLARREAEAAAARRAADAQRRQPVATTEAESEEDEFSALKEARALREAMVEALSAAQDDGAKPADAAAAAEAGSAEEAAAPAEE